jgi:hypothetical protein
LQRFFLSVARDCTLTRDLGGNCTSRTAPYAPDVPEPIDEGYETAQLLSVSLGNSEEGRCS